jgi:hypothetical protein
MVSDFMEAVCAMDERELAATLRHLPKGQLALIREGIDDGVYCPSPRVLDALAAAETPPIPPEPSDVSVKTEFAEVMRQRAAAKFHLYHPLDKILQPTPERQARQISHARNGSDILGDVLHWSKVQADDDEETIADQIRADRFAFVNSKGR